VCEVYDRNSGGTDNQTDARLGEFLRVHVLSKNQSQTSERLRYRGSHVLAIGSEVQISADGARWVSPCGTFDKAGVSYIVNDLRYIGACLQSGSKPFFKPGDAGMRGGTPHDELQICTTSRHTVPQCSVGRARHTGFVNAHAIFICQGNSGDPELFNFQSLSMITRITRCAIRLVTQVTRDCTCFPDRRDH
jgi:hypothetical protein